MTPLDARATAFIIPDWPGKPSDVHAFTTTKQLPSSAKIAPRTHWQPGAHERGNTIENDFAAHGCPLNHFLPAPPLWLNQVHGVDVFEANAANALSARAQPPHADASFTREKNVVLAILTADCLPVLIVDRESETIAAVHAGWRGLAANILENTMQRAALHPEHSTVWLSPAISSRAFEVGEDVFHAFDAEHDAEAAACFAVNEKGRWRADLYALARLKLRRIGITQIHGGEYCTYTDAQRFYSYRRQRDQGRIATFIWRS